MRAEPIMWFRIIIFIILLLMSIEDIRKMEVSMSLQVLLFLVIISIQGINFIILLCDLILVLVYIFYQRKHQIKIGGADILIICQLLLVDVEKTYYILFWSSLLALCYSIIKHKKIVPFVPFITLGYLIVFI